MADSNVVPNAMWWAQLHLNGGPRRLISTGFATVCIAASAFIGFRYVDRSIALTAYCDGVITVLAWIQMLVIIVGGCNAVFRAVTRDVTSKMMESHRVSPMTSFGVVSGYVFGATIQVLCIYAIGTVVGVIVIRWGTIGLSDWLGGNLFLLIVAIMAWTITVLVNVAGRKPVNPISVIVVISIISGTLMPLVPAFGLLSGFFAGWIGHRMMMGDPVVAVNEVSTLAVITVGMTLLWGRASMRLYRRPDLPAFGTLRALGLLAIWEAVCGIGALIQKSPTLPQMMRNGSADLPVVVMVSMAISLLIALLPVSSAANARCRVARGGRSVYLGDTMSTVLAATASAALLMALFMWLTWGLNNGWRDVANGFVASVASLAAAGGLFTMLYARQRRPTLIVLLFIAVLWAVPPLLDSWNRAWISTLDQPPSVLFGLSPFGTLAELVLELGADLRPGLAFQLLVGATLWYAGNKSLNRIRARQESE